MTIDWAAQLRPRSGERVKSLQHTPALSVQIGEEKVIEAPGFKGSHARLQNM